VKELHDFIDGNFTDVPGMPNTTERMTIEPIGSNLPPDYKPNPDYHL
jgi:hypothetical protein